MLIRSGGSADAMALAKKLTRSISFTSPSADSITGVYPDRETVGPPVNYSVRAILARFETLEAARAAREGAVLEWRKHDAAVRDAEAKLRDAEKAREDAWLNCLKGAAG